MSPKIFTSQNQKVGEIGENVASEYLARHGYRIVERNYTRKWGEIDIVASKDAVAYFFEVKALRKNFASREQVSGYKPEDNVSASKLARLRRVIQTYLIEKRIEDREWRFGLVTVLLDMDTRKARVEIYDDLVV